jgi:cell division protein FtsL
VAKPVAVPNLRVVPKPTAKTETTRKKPKAKRSPKPLSLAWRRRFRALGIVALFGTIVAVAFGAIGMHAHLAARQLELDSVRSEVVTAEREHQKLRLQVARLDTPEQVVSSAYALGLSSATQVEFLPTASTIAPAVAGPSAPGTP